MDWPTRHYSRLMGKGLSRKGAGAETVGTSYRKEVEAENGTEHGMAREEKEEQKPRLRGDLQTGQRLGGRKSRRSLWK